MPISPGSAARHRSLAIREAISDGRDAEDEDLHVALRHLVEAAGQLRYEDFDTTPYTAPQDTAPRRSWWG